MEQNTKSGGGRTLIGGTGYDVKLSKELVTLILSYGGSMTIEVDGTAHTGKVSESETIECEVGASVTITTPLSGWNFTLYQNGAQIGSFKTYTFAISKNTTIREESGFGYTRIDITT